MKRDQRRFDDLFQYFGPISLRRMFGGEALYAGERIIGLVMGDTLYLKTGDLNRGDFLAEGSKPFTYRRGKRLMATSYYAVPDRLLDDPEEFGAWARKAEAVACEARPARGKSGRSRKAISR